VPGLYAEPDISGDLAYHLVVRVLGAILLLAIMPAVAAAQQVNDDGWRFENRAPLFAAGAGPRVCIDEAHLQEHTVVNKFGPYARMLRGDGFRVVPFRSAIAPRTLAGCDVLISANPQAKAPGSPDFWPYPHHSAFARAEIDALVTWIRGGGAFLLFADHAPGAGASAGLAAALGLQVFDGWARVNDRDGNPEIYARAAGLFAAHPILDGRSEAERVDVLSVTIAGAFFGSEQFQPLVAFGPEARGYVRLGDMGQQLPGIPEREWPRFLLSGWWLAATREWGAGRVAVFGDATACTAQLYGPEREPLGMNHPEARHNARFCLNLVRWLARLR